MESPRERPLPNLPSTPMADAALEERRPPRTLRRAREVSSRYMIAVTSPAPPSSSSCVEHRAAPSTCPALPLPPPPRKPHPKPKHHHPLFPPACTAAADTERARARRSPSPQARRPPVPSSSSDVGDSDTEGSWFGDENLPEAAAAAPPVSRSLEVPTSSGLQGKPSGTQRRRAVRLFRENGTEQPSQPPPLPQLEHQKPADTLHSRGIESKFFVRKVRPGTPEAHFVERPADMGAITPRSTVEYQNPGLPLNPRTASRKASTQVSRSPRETLGGAGQLRALPPAPVIENRSVDTPTENSTVTDTSEAETCSISSPGGLCDSPPIPNHSSRARVGSDCRSSMPEADLLPTISSRLLAEGNPYHSDAINSSSFRGLSSSLCHRSLNSALSSCQQRQLNPTMSVSKLPTSLKAHSSSVRTDTAQQPAGKMGMDMRKGRKMSGRQEDSYALRLLENRYLQWKFVNAKAQAAVQAQRIVAERSLCGLSAKLQELHDSVTSKSTELEQLKGTRVISTILKAQMPHLAEWATLEDDYSHSLSGTIKSLQDASLRVPIIGNVRADTRELGEALDSATNVLAALAPQVGCFVPKADGMQSLLSDLAKVVNKERALTEEFGDLLVVAHKLQVNGYSLRAHLIQLKRTNSVQITAES